MSLTALSVLGRLPLKLLQVAVAAAEIRRAVRLLQAQSIDRLLTSSGGRALPVDAWQQRAAGRACKLPALNKAIERAARLFPQNRVTCLVRACAEVRLRQRYGAGSILLIGFRNGDDGRLKGHAWLAYPPVIDADSATHVVTAVFEMPARRGPGG